MKVIYFARYLRNNMTEGEKSFWNLVRRKSINKRKFLRQYPINYFFDGKKSSHFIADFYCHELKLIIEIDGQIHDAQRDYDDYRTSILEEMGYKVVRFTNQEVIEEEDAVLSKLFELTRV